MKIQTNSIILSLALLLVAVLALTQGANAAQIWTDQEDYGPDEVVYITGTGFNINSLITVTIVGPEEWGADQFDSLNFPWWVYWSFTEPDRLDIGYLKVKCFGTFTVTVTDGINTATTTFTDAINIQTLSVGTQSPTTVYPGDSATFAISSTWHGGGSSNSADLSITSWSPSTPADIIVGFSPAALTATTNTSTLTIDTSGSTSPGTYTFTVLAYTNSGQYATNTGTLVITSTPTPAPTVTNVSPASGEQGEILTSVIITGTNLTGASVVSFGAGITFNSYVVNDATQITANITIDGAAATGFRDVSVTTPGGTGTLTDGFSVTLSDTTPPNVSSIVRADPNPTNAASVDFTVTFSEPVTGVDTTDFDLTTTGLISGTAVTGISTTDNIVYTVTVSTGTGDGTIRLDVIDDDTISDLAGNELGGTGLGNGDFTTGEFYTIDSTPPTANIDVSDILINEADDGGTFDVIVTFSEAMDTTAIPTIGFSPNVVSSGTLTFYAGLWSVGDTVYTATYDVADVDQEAAGVDISVSGAQDLVGNLQDPNPTIETDLFDVDTIAPFVTGINVSDILINEADAGGTFDVTIAFSEVMDTSATPSISFDADVEGSGTLSFVSGAWSAGDTIYTATYNVADADEEQADVDVSVSGTQDLAGNPQDPDPATGTDMFDVDTLAPTGSITINGDALYTNTVNVTLNLTAMDGSGINAYRLADGTDATGGSPVSVGPTTDYDDDVPWTLPSGSGVKTVAVQYRDVAGNWSENYTDSIVLIDVLSAITAGGCPFDKDEGLEGQQFRLIFTQDPTDMSTYKLTASNPGQFFYNIFYVGTPGARAPAKLNIDVPDPFVTQGAMPVHVYSNVSFDGDCFVPEDEIGVLPAQSGNDPDFYLEVPIPDTGLVYVRIHLDYGLKKDVGYTSDASNNAEKPIGTDIIGDLDDYIFEVGGGMSDAVVIQNENVFKKIPGFGGMVAEVEADEIVGMVEGQAVTITGPGVDATVYTDEDGFYFLYYKHKGKEAEFTVECSGQSETVYMKANRLIEVNFDL